MTLEIKDLTVAYGKRVVLENISFSVEDGTIIGLVAPNGTGKTTLFNAVMRFIPIQNGEIKVDDQVFSDSEKDVLKLHRKITFFPDQADLHENFSGTEHIKMYADLWGNKQTDIQEIINRLKMGHYVDRKVKTYSLGMRQRLCFAMMVAANTPIMFMDEVMNGLDPENVSLVSDILIDLRKEGKIIVVASHLLDNLDEYADKVFFLKDKVLYKVTDHHDIQPVFYKIVCTQIQARKLEETITLPSTTIHLGNSVLCVPIEELDSEDELALYQAVRRLEDVILTVGPMGTSEMYSHIYSLELHSYDRGHMDGKSEEALPQT